MANLAALRATYLEAGVRFFVLAWRIRDAGQLDRLRAAMGMPLAVVRLEAPLEVIERRLAPDPTAERAEDLRVAAAELAAGDDGLPAGDVGVDADRPVAEIADDVLATSAGRRPGRGRSAPSLILGRPSAVRWE